MSPRCICCDEKQSRNELEYLQCEQCDNWVCEDCECPCEPEEETEEEPEEDAITIVDEPMDIDSYYSEILGRFVEV